MCDNQGPVFHILFACLIINNHSLHWFLAVYYAFICRSVVKFALLHVCINICRGQQTSRREEKKKEIGLASLEWVLLEGGRGPRIEQVGI